MFKTDLRGITLGQGLYRSGSLSYLDNLLSRSCTSCENCKRFCFSCSLIACASPFQHSRMRALRKFFGHEVHRPTLPLPQVRTFPYPMDSGNSIWEDQNACSLLSFTFTMPKTELMSNYMKNQGIVFCKTTYRINHRGCGGEVATLQTSIRGSSVHYTFLYHFNRKGRLLYTFTTGPFF